MGGSATQLANQILEERFPPGQELIVFDQGSRIGTFTVSSQLGTTSDYCPPRAQALGFLELIPSASEVQRFLALEEPQGLEWPRGQYHVWAVERAHRTAAQNLGGEALNQLGAPWPAGLQNIRQDLQVFQLPDGEGLSVVATFLFQDQLVVGPTSDASYSLLVLGELRGNRFDRTFTWFRPVADEGKGAPRFFSWMDWDRDGEEEILLEVLGVESRWWAALDRENGRWSLTFQDSCGAPEAQGSYEQDTEGESQ